MGKNLNWNPILEKKCGVLAAMDRLGLDLVALPGARLPAGYNRAVCGHPHAAGVQRDDLGAAIGDAPRAGRLSAVDAVHGVRVGERGGEDGGRASLIAKCSRRQTIACCVN